MREKVPEKITGKGMTQWDWGRAVERGHGRAVAPGPRAGITDSTQGKLPLPVAPDIPGGPWGPWNPVKEKEWLGHCDLG